MTRRGIESEIVMIDAGTGWASIAISLRRIADALEKQNAFRGISTYEDRQISEEITKDGPSVSDDDIPF